MAHLLVALVGSGCAPSGAARGDAPTPAPPRPRARLPQIMVLSTFLPIAAARFGLAPSSFKGTGPKAGLKLYDRSAGLATNDPAGACAVPTARGAAGGQAGRRGRCSLRTCSS